MFTSWLVTLNPDPPFGQGHSACVETKRVICRPGRVPTEVDFRIDSRIDNFLDTLKAGPLTPNTCNGYNDRHARIILEYETENCSHRTAV